MRWISPLAILFPALLFMAACGDMPTAPSLRGDGPSFEAHTVQGCVMDGYCVLPPISGGACDPFLELDWSCEGGGDCMTAVPGADSDSTHLGLAGCPYPPGSGGGAFEPPADPEPGDTCATGDEALDSPAVQQGLDSLWRISNADGPQAQRREQAAWIIQEADGSFRIAPFAVSAQTPCSVNGNFLAPPRAVAWIHTHPFRQGETQTSCGALKQPDPGAPGGSRDVLGPDGQPVYPQYRNNPSIPDRELMNDINATLDKMGRNRVAGVIIDADRITVYTENAGEQPMPFSRCGY